MDDDSKWIERRAFPRIHRRFIVRVKPKDAAGSRWDLPTLKDISLGGCYFYTGIPFKAGQSIALEVTLPVLEHPMHFTGIVKRVDGQEERSLPQYGVAVQFVELEENKKEKFEEVISFSLNREQH